MIHVKKRKAPTRRRRLSAEDARETILAATEKKLLEVGPEGLRLQEIAKDVGVSHPTVLHHFGSREELVAAVVHRSMLALETELVACFTTNVDPAEIPGTLDRIDEVMRHRGQARLLAWLALVQPGAADKKESRLGDLTAAIHAARNAMGSSAPLEDSVFGVLLASVSLFGVALIGPALLRMIGASDDEATLRRFRLWFAGLLVHHVGMEAAPVATPTKAKRRPK